MSFVGKKTKGTVIAPGYFVAPDEEQIIRETRQIAENSPFVVVGETGGKHIPMGTPYPANDGTAIGLLYEGVDVTNGDMPGPVIIGNATIYEDRLPVTLAAAAKTALEARNFRFVASAPATTRPY